MVHARSRLQPPGGARRAARRGQRGGRRQGPRLERLGHEPDLAGPARRDRRPAARAGRTAPGGDAACHRPSRARQDPHRRGEIRAAAGPPGVGPRLPGAWFHHPRQRGFRRGLRRPARWSRDRSGAGRPPALRPQARQGRAAVAGGTGRPEDRRARRHRAGGHDPVPVSGPIRRRGPARTSLGVRRCHRQPIRRLPLRPGARIVSSRRRPRRRRRRRRSCSRPSACRSAWRPPAIRR